MQIVATARTPGATRSGTASSARRPPRGRGRSPSPPPTPTGSRSPARSRSCVDRRVEIDPVLLPEANPAWPYAAALRALNAPAPVAWSMPLGEPPAGSGLRSSRPARSPAPAAAPGRAAASSCGRRTAAQPRQERAYRLRTVEGPTGDRLRRRWTPAPRSGSARLPPVGRRQRRRRANQSPTETAGTTRCSCDSGAGREALVRRARRRRPRVRRVHRMSRSAADGTIFAAGSDRGGDDAGARRRLLPRRGGALEQDLGRPRLRPAQSGSRWTPAVHSASASRSPPAWPPLRLPPRRHASTGPPPRPRRRGAAASAVDVACRRGRQRSHHRLLPRWRHGERRRRRRRSAPPGLLRGSWGWTPPEEVAGSVRDRRAPRRPPRHRRGAWRGQASWPRSHPPATLLWSAEESSDPGRQADFYDLALDARGGLLGRRRRVAGATESEPFNETLLVRYDADGSTQLGPDLGPRGGDGRARPRRRGSAGRVRAPRDHARLRPAGHSARPGSPPRSSTLTAPSTPTATAYREARTATTPTPCCPRAARRPSTGSTTTATAPWTRAVTTRTATGRLRRRLRRRRPPRVPRRRRNPPRRRGPGLQRL